MKAAEDFLQAVVLHGYIVAAAEAICGTSVGSNLSLSELSKAIVEKFVQICVPSPSSPKVTKVKDKKYLYVT